MSGVFRDGVLGSVFRDGVLGNLAVSGPGYAFQDGTLGASVSKKQAGVRTGTSTPGIRRPNFMQSYRVQSVHGPGYAFQDGTLGATRGFRSVSGCGCSGVGEDAPPATPFYKKPLYIAGAAAVLGIAIYVARK